MHEARSFKGLNLLLPEQRFTVSLSDRITERDVLIEKKHNPDLFSAKMSL